MKKYTLNDYLIRLNKLLESNDFAEKFVFGKKIIQGKEYDFIILRHLIDKQKTIEFMDNEDDLYNDDTSSDGGVLCCMSTHSHGCHTHIDCFDDESIEDLVASIFDEVKDTLENKIVSYYAEDKQSRIGGGSMAFYADPNSFKYRKKEKDYLAKNDIIFEKWSEAVSENEKLFIIGSCYTDMPEIKTAWKKYLASFN